MAGGLTRWDPLADVTQLRSSFDRLLDELGGQDHGAWMPAIDLVRHDDVFGRPRGSAWHQEQPDRPSRA